jgi:HEAT repeat protein
MGTGAAAGHAAGGMKISITNYELKITNSRQRITIFAILCLVFLCAENIFAQDFETLAEQIRSGSSEQKRDALFQIRNLRTAEASRFAVAALNDSDEIVRATAAFSVIYLPKDEALARLAPLLRDKSELVRRETAYALGKIQNSAAVNLLIQTVQKDKIQDVKNAAVVALGEIGDAAAIDALAQILTRRPKEDEEFFRRSAARSIGQIAQILQTDARQKATPESFLPDELKRTLKFEYKNLGEAFPSFRSAVQILLQTLQNPREADDVKREAAFALGAIGDRAAVETLRKNLSSEDYYLAEIAAEALRKINSKTE